MVSHKPQPVHPSSIQTVFIAINSVLFLIVENTVQFIPNPILLILFVPF